MELPFLPRNHTIAQLPRFTHHCEQRFGIGVLIAGQQGFGILPSARRGNTSNRNPYAQEILEVLERETGDPWLARAWRQYMFWFMDIESRISNGSADVRSMLRSADELWRQLDAEDELMEEHRNDGSWIRAWRRATKAAMG